MKLNKIGLGKNLPENTYYKPTDNWKIDEDIIANYEPVPGNLSFNRYIDVLLRSWCKEQRVIYPILLTTIKLAILSGDIIVKKQSAFKAITENSIANRFNNLGSIDLENSLYTLCSPLGYKINTYDSADISLGYIAYVNTISKEKR